MAERRSSEAVVRTGVPGLDAILLRPGSRASLSGGRHTRLRQDHAGLVVSFGRPSLGRAPPLHHVVRNGPGTDGGCPQSRLVARLTILDIVPLEADPDRQQGLVHPSEVELDHTVGLMLDKIRELRPDRLVVDAVTQLRLLAQDPQLSARQILRPRARGHSNRIAERFGQQAHRGHRSKNSWRRCSPSDRAQVQSPALSNHAVLRRSARSPSRCNSAPTWRPRSHRRSARGWS
jgi:hypothetical protein